MSTPRLLRLREVMERTGKSRSAIYAEPGFPRKVKIGKRAVAWREDEIEAWLAAATARRDKEEGEPEP
jgi:prophage regulatory protein